MITAIANWRPALLENDKVRILPLADTDFERLYAVASDPLIWTQHPDYLRYTRPVFQSFFDGALASGSAFLVFDRERDLLIGTTRYYDYDPMGNSVAIGYTFLARSHWGGLYNGAAKKLLLDYAFGFVDRVFFHIGATNIRSQLGTMKTGAVKVRELDLDMVPHYEYELKKENHK